jgi:predicted MFS family arabinose efflux permease
LFGGFASTIFWPLTLHLKSTWNWREILLVYAALQILVCLPLHILLKPKRALPKPPYAGEHKPARSHTLREALQHPAFWKLALAFATNSFVFSALSVHLIPMLINMGHPAAIAVFLAAWIGPMQVAGRIGEMTFAKHALPQTVGKFVFSALPAALLALLLLGQQQWVVAVFCVLYGLSNGIITIVRGTIPQALFGRENYGAISGAMAGPALVSKAAGPLILAALMQMQGSVSPLLTLLLACSSISLLFYFSAVKSAAATEGIQTIKA